MIPLYNICWFLLVQTQGVGANVETPAGAATDAAQKTPGFFDSMGFMFPALMAVMLLYFIMMAKPQPNSKVKPSELLANLKKNDRIVTAGGILGTVVNFGSEDEYVTIRIDETSKARMQVLASSIVRVLSDDDDK
jgi:preprotein translocase subunit YajC